MEHTLSKDCPCNPTVEVVEPYRTNYEAVVPEALRQEVEARLINLFAAPVSLLELRSRVEDWTKAVVMASYTWPEALPEWAEQPGGAEQPRTRALDSVLDLHTKRKATNDYMAPYEYEFCVECRQTWPCATVAAVMNNAQTGGGSDG